MTTILVQVLFASALVTLTPVVSKAMGGSVAGMISVAPILSAYVLLTSTAGASLAAKTEQTLWSAVGMVPGAVFYIAFYVALRCHLSQSVGLGCGVVAWFLCAALFRKCA